MARTVNQEEYARKRNEILAAAQRLIYTKGYERMTMQDLLAELGMSSGALYHYFDSKPALLEGFIERMREEVEKPLLPILHDPDLTALEKLQGFFNTLNQVRMSLRDDVINMARVWYSDGNAIVRQKVNAAVIEQRAPLLTEIVRQGVGEGVFTVTYPEHAGEVMMVLLQGFADAHTRNVFALVEDPGDASAVEALVTSHAACMEALERMLGAPANALYRFDAQDVRGWLAALDTKP